MVSTLAILQTFTMDRYNKVLCFMRIEKVAIMEQNRVYFFDTTLRDGEQTPGVSLQTPEKIEIAKGLVRLGIDVIEADRKSTRLNSSHLKLSRMPSSA